MCVCVCVCVSVHRCGSLDVDVECVSLHLCLCMYVSVSACVHIQTNYTTMCVHLCVAVHMSGRVQEVACSGDICRGSASHSERGLEAETHPHTQGDYKCYWCVCLFVCLDLLDLLVITKSTFTTNQG